MSKKNKAAFWKLAMLLGMSSYVVILLLVLSLSDEAYRIFMVRIPEAFRALDALSILSGVILHCVLCLVSTGIYYFFFKFLIWTRPKPVLVIIERPPTR